MRPTFIMRFYNIYTPMLGRWTISYNYKVQNFKIDNANVDHCGCCENQPEKAAAAAAESNNDDDLWPYCM